MASSSLLQEILDISPSLSPSEQRVADFVTREPETVAGMTLAKLARAAGVSEPTVIRFCARMNFAGYQELRVRMAQFLALGIPATHSAIDGQDSPATIASKIFDYTIASLDHTRTTLAPTAIVAAVEAIVRAKRLHFLGFGASAVVAMDAGQKAVLFDRPCEVVSDPHQQFISAATADADDLFVIISYTGASNPLSTIAAEAQSNGATVLAITGNPDSVLAEITDITIVTETLENTNLYTPTISRIAALLVIDVLATAVAARAEPDRFRRIETMKAKLSQFRGSDPYA
jgi:RpiR family carbohydrate utilization transcriptional regulator